MESGFVALIAIVAIVLGIVLGVVIERLRKRHTNSQGILFVDCSDPQYEPSLFLNATVPIEEIVVRKQVVFNVNVLR